MFKTFSLLKVIRSHIVIGGFLGFNLGVLLGLDTGGKLSPAMYILGFMIILFGDLSTHFSNDFFDIEVDKKSPHKTFGGSNFLVDHPELRRASIISALVLSMTSVGIAYLMVPIFSSPLLLPLLVLATNLAGWVYSTPPVRLNSRGLGEVTIAIGTGFAIPCIGYFLAIGAIDRSFLIFSFLPVLYGFILSLSLELPDLEADFEYGRKNLVVLGGRRKTSILILLLCLVAEGYTIFLMPELVNRFQILPILLVVPLIAGVIVLRNPDNLYWADKNSVVVISSLFIFLVSLDFYLLSRIL